MRCLLAATAREHPILDGAVGEILERPRRQLLLARPRAISRKLVDDTGIFCRHEHAQIFVGSMLRDFDWRENLHGITRLNCCRLPAAIARSASEPALPDREYALAGSSPPRSPPRPASPLPPERRSPRRNDNPRRAEAPPARSSCVVRATPGPRSSAPAASPAAHRPTAAARIPGLRAGTSVRPARLPARRYP